MKIFKITVLTFFILGAGIHFLVWMINHDLHDSQKKQRVTFSQEELELRHIRMNLMQKQKKDLESYGSLDKDKIWVQIPVERAYDYYLESLPR